MDRARWQRIEALLDQLFDAPPERRAAIIAAATNDDPALRHEVESLLAAREEAGSFLEVPAVAGLMTPPTASGSAVDRDASLVGTVLGSWQVVRKLGHGGMGTVYLAERADGQFQQRVALKVVKRGMDSAEILRRFLAERQILARLDHPGIARLIDGGTAPSGRPWLALEYVEGEPITRAADSQGLRVAQRVHLFERVCEAVGYAHQRLVVHRDLKPSNILVTAAGDVKLLDFGIAKVLHGQSEGDQTNTALGHWVLTPEYGAPEQVKGEAITTATDVYALGALLYELLTGHRAHALAERSLAEVLRVVCDVAPARPSLAVAQPLSVRHSDGREETLSADALARQRGASPAALARILSGDLDTAPTMR